ncbi:MAG TPA: glutaredoxin family protein [Acidiferrobacterales bacterium]|nr:glutaredoxin family protein [Acidiferrobacterales bacterium]
MQKLTLYTTLGCHLCDEARALLTATLGPHIQFDEIDISDNRTLMEHYGTRIPLLRRDTGQELNWPFSAPEIALFLR